MTSSTTIVLSILSGQTESDLNAAALRLLKGYPRIRHRAAQIVPCDAGKSEFRLAVTGSDEEIRAFETELRKKADWLCLLNGRRRIPEIMVPEKLLSVMEDCECVAGMMGDNPLSQEFISAVQGLSAMLRDPTRRRHVSENGCRYMFVDKGHLYRMLELAAEVPRFVERAQAVQRMCLGLNSALHLVYWNEPFASKIVRAAYDDGKPSRYPSLSDLTLGDSGGWW